MQSLRHFPLGERFPDSPHAVISSLPTMADVIGYEEKDPRVLDALTSGYPRFVVHEYVSRLIDFFADREGLEGIYGVLVSDRQAASDLVEWVGSDLLVREVESCVFLIGCDSADESRSSNLRRYVQHTGCGISSRHAEDLLIAYGLLDSPFDEEVFEGDSLGRVRDHLSEHIGCSQSDLRVCASGMSAFFAGFRLAQEAQASKGRKVWIQLGWLYLDSGCVLQKFLKEGESVECVYEVEDLSELLTRIEQAGDSLAGVVVECPSNPLVRVCDLDVVSSAVRTQGGLMLVDPTIASIYNVDVLPFADILVTSLTKYVSIEGDIMIGAIALNQSSPVYEELRERLDRFIVAPYPRDLARLAYQMKYSLAVVQRMNENAAKLCRFLRAHPMVERIYCAGCSDNIEKVSKGDGPVGAVISVDLVNSSEKFYDALRLMKGPSFGMRYTSVCPFVYLAHYDLIISTKGEEFLKNVGIRPDLIRISVGEEPYEEIEAVFDEALKGV